MSNKNTQLPTNLVEALGATPFTYLVPTQNLATQIGFGKVELPIEPEYNSPDYQQYSSALKKALESDNPQFNALKKQIESHLSFDKAVQNSPFSFEILQMQALDDDNETSTGSLFDGLKGLSRDIVLNCPLIREDQLILRMPSRETAPLLFPVETVKKEKVPEHVSQSIPSKPAGSVPILIPLESPFKKTDASLNHSNTSNDPKPLADSPSENSSKHTILPSSKDITLIKKRKPETGVQHLQFQNISIKKLVDLMHNKIKMTDEAAEYESSDLWIEWKNSSHSLSDSAIQEIEQLLISLQNTPLVHDVPVEILERIEILALRSVTNANETEWLTPENEDFEKSNVFANNTFKAISLIFTVLNLKRAEKKLYLESYLMDSLTFLNSYIQDILSETISSKDLAYKKVTHSLYQISKIFSQLSKFIPYNQVDETIITKLEYLTIFILFIQTDKSVIFFKSASLSLLLSVFQSKVNQRGFIIEELLNNFDKLITHKIYARQIKLSRGVSIQFFTVILLNLVECLNLSDTTYASDLDKVNAEDKEDKRFQNCLKLNKSERQKLLTTISSSLVTKLINNPTMITKQLFELLVRDLLDIVIYPEWSSASELLAEITKTMMCISENQVSIVETHLLEMIGLVGSKMLEIRGPNDVASTSIADLSDDFKNVLEYLSKLKNQKYFEYNYDFFFTQWIEEITEYVGEQQPQSDKIYNKLLSGYYQSKKNELFAFTDLDFGSLELNATTSYLPILLHSPFLQLYHSFLNHLLKSIDHPKIKSKTKALKNLSLLIDKDQRLLEIPQIKQTLFNKINDPSALVRMAILDIFDQFVSKRPQIIPDLYHSIVLTNDKSTAVRIKSIKIAKVMILSSTNKEIIISLLEKILRRLEDEEESILELTKNALVELIFQPIINNLSRTMELKTKVVYQTDLLVMLVNKSEKNWDLFESFLLGDIIRKQEKNLKIHPDLMNSCSQITIQLFDYIVTNIDTQEQTKLEETLGLLSILSKSDIPFINQEQLLSLQTYLTSDQKSGKISYYALVILRSSLNQTNSLRDQFITSSLTSLLKKLTKFNAKELDQAMPCIWALSEMKKDTTKVSNAAASCLSLIRPFVEKAIKGQLQESSDQKILRLIYLIGSFGKYCDLEQHRLIFQNPKKFQLKEKETVLSLVTKTVLVFTKNNINRQIRRVAIRNLIHICSTHPKLFTTESILTVLDGEILKDNNDDFKEVIIQGLLEFLENEEKDSIEKVGYEKKSSTKVGLDVDVFHGNSNTFENDGICASLVQRYTEPILELCLREDGGISFLAVRFLRFIIKLGFANPRMCVPTVIALEASPISFIKNTGFELHRELHEKHESLVDSSYFRGIKLAASFRIKVSKDISKEDCQFFPKFYKIIENSRSSKKKLFSQLIKYFNFNAQESSLDDLKTLNEFLMFFVPNLCQVDFETYEYVVDLIESIDTIIHKHLSLVSNKFQEFKTLGESFAPNGDILKILYEANILINLEKLMTGLRHYYKFHDLKYSSPSEIKDLKVKTIEHKIPIKASIYDADSVPIDTLISIFNATVSKVNTI